MILSAIPWGFVADTMGRRLVLISGGWMDGFCVLFAAMSQNSHQLMVCKFFDGLLWVCMPYASGLSLYFCLRLFAPQHLWSVRGGRQQSGRVSRHEAQAFRHALRRREHLAGRTHSAHACLLSAARAHLLQYWRIAL